MQPNILNPLVSSVPVTYLVQSVVSVSSSIPLVSGEAVPPLGGKNLNVSMVSSATHVSSSQAHMVDMNQPSFGVIQNPAGLSNVQYQQVQNLIGLSRSSNFQY